MLKLSRTQIQNFEAARRQASTQAIADKLAENSAEPGGEQNAEVIAAFCAEHNILRAENMQRIALAHVKLGLAAPDAHLTVPLRRKGFGENERVRAYLYALETKKKRLVLPQTG